MIIGRLDTSHPEQPPRWVELAQLHSPTPGMGGAAAAAWTDCGRALAVSWQSDLCIYRWRSPGHDPGSWDAAACTATTMLTGLPGPFRALVSGAAGTLVGTLDAGLALPPPAEPLPVHTAPAAEPAQASGSGADGTASTSDRRRSGTSGGVDAGDAAVDGIGSGHSATPTVNPNWAGRDQADKQGRRSSSGSGGAGPRRSSGSAGGGVIDLRGALGSSGGSPPRAPVGGTLSQLLNITGGGTAAAALADGAPPQSSAGGSIPAGFVLGSSVAQPAVAPARICLLWPPGAGSGSNDGASSRGRQRSRGAAGRSSGTGRSGASLHGASVADVALPRPDVLHAQGSLALVASSSGPPLVLVYHSCPLGGLTPLQSLDLGGVPSWAGTPRPALRIRGLLLRPAAAASSWDGSGERDPARQLVALLARPQQQGQQPGAFTSLAKGPGGTVAAIVSLAVAEYSLGGVEQQLMQLQRLAVVAEAQADEEQQAASASETAGRPHHQHPAAPCSPVAAPPTAAAAAPGGSAPQQQGAAAAGPDPLQQILGALQGLQGQLDQRLGAMSGVLKSFGSRLESLEARVAGQAPGSGGGGGH